MTQQVITAFFDKRADADKAVSELVKAGVLRTSIRVMPETSYASTPAQSSYDIKHDEKGFWASLAEMFMPEEDRYTYAEALHRGSIMVTATVDDKLVPKAEDILEEYGSIDIGEREQTWKKEGWKGYTAGSTDTRSASGRAGAEQGIIPVVEEQLKVGKRQVQAGRVKVRSYVIETPVHEQVTLRTESVHVEHRPVDRPLAPGEDIFKERTIEAQATSEETVVSKNARVTGEVVIQKNVGEHTETVSDTVRSTKVEVDVPRTPAVPRKP